MTRRRHTARWWVNWGFNPPGAAWHYNPNYPRSHHRIWQVAATWHLPYLLRWGRFDTPYVICWRAGPLSVTVCDLTRPWAEGRHPDGA